MPPLFAPLLSLLLGAGPSTQDSTSMMLFDFTTPTESSWQVVNDGVMGGRSQGRVDLGEGRLRFDGTLVTQGGGFTSVRSFERFDLEGYDGIELRVRGIGREFELEVGDGMSYRGRSISRRAPFPTTGEWQDVRVPFDALRPSIFGQPLSAPPLDPARVRRVGLFILDGIDGDFWLEVESIRAYRVGGP